MIDEKDLDAELVKIAKQLLPVTTFGVDMVQAKHNVVEHVKYLKKEIMREQYEQYRCRCSHLVEEYFDRE